MSSAGNCLWVRKREMSRSSGTIGMERCKRAHSMDSWLTDRDEDLALFHDMRVLERSNFLHPSKDDIEASLSTKFGGLSGYRYLLSTPTHKGGLDLLMADAGKNDYDWLLTPPGTPLFPSLDQDASIMNLSQRGVLSRSASASKAPRLSHSQEPSSKALRGNLSPCRPSTASSTSSTNTHNTTKGWVPSSSHNSSSSSLRSGRSTTPRRTASGTVSRPARSSPPILRRTNTAPTIRSSSVSQATVRNQGSSLSPKLQGWNPSSLPGLSSEPPPNLRTSISDRSMISSRGLSLGTRLAGANGTRYPYAETLETAQSRRQPISPNTSRSSSSFFSQDQCSSQTSKGSVASSCDEDMETCQLALSGRKMTGTNCTLTGTNGTVRMEEQPGSRCILPAKCQTRAIMSREKATSVGVAARKPIEPFVRQVDRRRHSQSMFRPLLYSVPASSFYSTRHSGIQCGSSIPALESSSGISSNVGSEQTVCIVPDNESATELEGKESKWQKNLSHDVSAKKLNRHCKHHSLDLQNVSGMDGVHPSKSRIGNGNESSDTEPGLTIEKNLVEAFKRRTWNDSRTESHKEVLKPVRQEHYLIDGFDSGCTDNGLASVDPQKNNDFLQCGKENTDNLFMDTEQDLSTTHQSHRIQNLEFGDECSNSSACLCYPETDSVQRFPALKQESALMHDANVALEVATCFPQEQHELMTFEEKKCILGSDLKRPNHHGELQTSDQLGWEQSICAGDKILNSNIEVYKAEGSEFPSHNTVESAMKSQSLLNNYLTTAYLQLSSEGRQVDSSRSGSIVSDCNAAVNLAVDGRVDASLIIADTGGSDILEPDTGFRLQDGTVAIEKSLSCDGAVPVVHFLCQDMLDHTRIDDTKDGARCSCNMPYNCIKKDHRVVTPSVTEKVEDWSRMLSEDSSQEHFEGALEAAAIFGSRFSQEFENSRGSSNILIISSPPVSSDKAVLSGEKIGFQVCKPNDVNSEEDNALICSPVLSPFLNVNNQRSNPMRDVVITDRTDFSTQEVPEDLIQHIEQRSFSASELEREGTMWPVDLPLTDCASEQVLPANLCSQGKAAGDGHSEQQWSMLESRISVSQRIESCRLQVGPMFDADEVMDQRDFVEDSLQSRSISQNLELVPSSPGVMGGKYQTEVALLSTSTLEEANDAILFCSSIVHDMLSKAATIAMAREQHKAVATPTELVRLCGLPEVGYRTLSMGNEKGTVGGSSAVRRTLTYVQKNQKMVLQQTPAVTYQKCPMDKTGTAELNTEKAFTMPVIRVPQQDYKTSKMKSRCSCSVM